LNWRGQAIREVWEDKGKFAKTLIYIRESAIKFEPQTEVSVKMGGV